MRTRHFSFIVSNFRFLQILRNYCRQLSHITHALRHFTIAVNDKHRRHTSHIICQHILRLLSHWVIHRYPWQVLCSLSPCHRVRVKTHLEYFKTLCVILLIHVIKHLVKRRRETCLIHREVQYYHIALLRIFEQIVVHSIVVLKCDVEQFCHMSLHSVHIVVSLTAATLAVKQQIHQVVGAWVIRLKCVI